MEIWIKFTGDKFEYGVLDDYGDHIPFHEAENLVIDVVGEFLDVITSHGSQPLLKVLDGGKGEE